MSTLDVALAYGLLFSLWTWSPIAMRFPFTKEPTPHRSHPPVVPGDDIVSRPESGYTMDVTISAAASDVWPWLVQMGQGRGGFYTHEWVENLLGAHIRNADRIVAEWQHLDVGDTVRLTPDPYFGQRGQFMTVAEIQPERALVFRQTLPNGAPATWAFLLVPEDQGTTRVIMRRRAGHPSLFDKVMARGYAFMDRGVLDGLRERVEAASAEDGGRHDAATMDKRVGGHAG